MKFKIIIVDFEIPARLKHWGLRLGIPTALALGGGAVAYGAGVVSWVDGQTLKASDLNGNFAALDQRTTALEGAASCPDPTAIKNYGFCIWPDTNGAAHYTQVFRDAAATCKAKGGRLCTLAEVSAAQAAGAEWCANSWTADRVDNSTAYVAYPNQTAACGGRVVVSSAEPMATFLADANCCKP
jgi:hypothetical protein